MPDLFARIPLLFAQAQNAPPAGGGSPNSFLSLLPYLGIPLIFYFVMFRPQQQQERKRRQAIDALKKNDKVLTAGGIFGTVVSIDNERGRIVLRVDDERSVKLAFSKASISQVLDSPSEKGSESA